MGAETVLISAQQRNAILLDSGAFTDAGSRYRDLNQDYAEVGTVYSADDIRDSGSGPQHDHIAAVLDGHGMLGELAAQRAGAAAVTTARAALLAESKAARDPNPDLEAARLADVLHAAFEAGHAAALELYKDPPPKYCYPSVLRDENYRLMWVGGLPMYVGSTPQPRLIEFGATCTLALLRSSLLAVGNAGDSAAVLGRRHHDGSFTGEELTVRHWGLNPEERTRVQVQRNGHVDIMNSDGYLSVASGRWKGYQLSMTRALGHSMLSDFGVIWTPSVRLHRLVPGDCCLVVASDGVWDVRLNHLTVFGANEAVRIVMDVLDAGGGAAMAAETLVREAVRRAMDGPDGDADNTTAAVLAFAVPPSPLANGDSSSAQSSGQLEYQLSTAGFSTAGLSGSEGGSAHSGSVYGGSSHGGSGVFDGNTQGGYSAELHPPGAIHIGVRGMIPEDGGCTAAHGIVAYGGSAHGGTAFGGAARCLDGPHHPRLSSSV